MKEVTEKVSSEISRIMEKVATYDNSCFKFRVELQGSTSEGLKIVKPDEFDFGLRNDDWTDKIVLFVNQTAPAGKGYAQSVSKTCLDRFKITGTQALDPLNVRNHLRDLVEQAMIDLNMKGKVPKRPWVTGPAVTFEFSAKDFVNFVPSERLFRISVDLVIGIDLTQWPAGARERPTGVDNARAQLVPKVKLPDQPKFWRISFSDVEKAIMQNIDNDCGCRKKVLQLAKYFKEKTKERWYPLSTYHLKNVLLHMKEARNDPRDWRPEMLVPRFKEFIEKLLGYVRSGSLPHFFIPRHNLLAEDNPGGVSAITSLTEFLTTLRANPNAFLK